MDLNSLLSALPDNVKRSIVARLDEPVVEQHHQEQQWQQQQQLVHAQEKEQSPGAQTPAACRPLPSTLTAARATAPSANAALVAARGIELPLMRGGACIVDNCLTSDEVQVSSSSSGVP